MHTLIYFFAFRFYLIYQSYTDSLHLNCTYSPVVCFHNLLNVKVDRIPFHYVSSEYIRQFCPLLPLNAAMRRFKISAFILVLHCTNFFKFIQHFSQNYAIFCFKVSGFVPAFLHLSFA